MNYLIQAFACSPNLGGEYAVSWGWIFHLDRVVNEKDCIYVLSCTLSQNEIDEASLKHVKLVIVSGMEKYNFLNYNKMYYEIWQRKAYKIVKNMNLKIDVCHMYSLSDFRQPGFWSSLKNSFTILGPVGGGQICPNCLRSYDNKKGRIREVVNLFLIWNPFWRIKVHKYSVIYACNRETLKYFKYARFLPDVPLNDNFLNLEIEERNNTKITIICVGRLINKKGFLFLLDVLSQVKTKYDFKVLIYGSGEQKDLLEQRIFEYRLQSKVFLKGSIPYDKVSEIYRSGDLFVLPSLRESGGSVLIEAMAHKLPIVALDMSLSSILKEKRCGYFVNTKQPKENLIKEFARNLETLIEDENLRKFFGNNGYLYVNRELNWESMIDKVYGNFIYNN